MKPLSNRIAECRLERKACAQRLQHQQDQVLQSQTQQQSLQEQLDKWKDHPTDCTNTILTLEKRRSGDETKIKALQEKLKHWDSHPDCKKTISQLEVRLEEESKKLRPLELHLASCKTETETLKQQLHDRDRKISSFENEVTGYKKEIQELKQKLQDAPTNNSGDPYEGLGGA
jgi:chromosome segregation ATPase